MPAVVVSSLPCSFLPLISRKVVLSFRKEREWAIMPFCPQNKIHVHVAVRCVLFLTFVLCSWSYDRGNKSMRYVFLLMKGVLG